ncbi:MAG: tRNA glutamyl-Q(34) synthetase GluQRS [Clostridium sp.]|nr:tRNA glutamyl-Q(34) synthetase GluQRS [Clostridium sp.]
MTPDLVKGRFAPSPSGRMHLGNVFSALLSWLSAKSKGGKWLLRIEDLDRQRSKLEYARLIEDDLRWLGLHWDEGGLDNIGPAGPYSQSARGDVYQKYFDELRERGLLYRCACRRADILAQQAPHESDGRIVYGGACRPAPQPPFPASADGIGAWRLYVPDEIIYVEDDAFGRQEVNLAKHCGDFVLRRADGGWAYQLAVVVDDALMGVTEVVRGCDLLLSAAQQSYLYDLFGWPRPRYAHVPLICNSEGQRLSKRDRSLSMEELRKTRAPEEIIGLIAHLAGLQPAPTPCAPASLLPKFNPSPIPNPRPLIKL